MKIPPVPFLCPFRFGEIRGEALVEEFHLEIYSTPSKKPVQTGQSQGPVEERKPRGARK